MAAWPGADGARARSVRRARAPRPARTRPAQIIGQRAEGVLRFPEAVAVDTQGDVYVADQLELRRAEVHAPPARFETEWGSYGGGHGQFGPIGGLATDAAGNVYVVDSSHNRIEKFDSDGNFITAWGHTRQRTRCSSTSAPRRTPPSRRAAASRSPANYVYVADSGNNRIERFNLEGGEPMQWGSYGSGPGQFSYPRGVAANESEVIVTDDDNHRIEKFDLDGELPGRGRLPRHAGRASSASPTASRWTRPATSTSPTTSTTASSSSTRSSASLGAWGGFGSKPGQLAFPRALASDPAGDTYVADTANDRDPGVRPERRLPAHDRRLRARGPAS